MTFSTSPFKRVSLGSSEENRISIELADGIGEGFGDFLMSFVGLLTWNA